MKYNTSRINNYFEKLGPNYANGQEDLLALFIWQMAGKDLFEWGSKRAVMTGVRKSLCCRILVRRPEGETLCCCPASSLPLYMTLSLSFSHCFDDTQTAVILLIFFFFLVYWQNELKNHFWGVC